MPAGSEKGIVGSDNRIVIDHLRNQYPWNNHGAMDGAAFCTAFKVINHFTAGTAAHCVHTGSGWKTRLDITFSDGSLGKVPASCYGRTVPGEWTSHPNLPKNDYAVMRFRGPGAYCTLSNYDVGYLGNQGVGYTTSLNAILSGYPGPTRNPPGVTQGTYPHLVYHYRGGAEVGVFQARVLKYENDTMPGQSGTAVMTFHGGTDYRVRGVHGGEFDVWFVEYNQGREFDDTVRSFMSSHAGS